MKKSFRILCLGNSFSQDATFYLYDVLQAAGYEEIIVGNLFIPGASLEQHNNNIENGFKNYEYFYNHDNTWINRGLHSYNDVIKLEDWDFITIQQASHYSGEITTYEPYLSNIIKFTNLNKLTKTKLFWHETWAYQEDATHPEFVRYQNSQVIMYKKIKEVTNNKILTNSNFKGVINNGTIIQRIRETSIGDNITVDGYHLNDKGKVAAAINIYYSIMGLEEFKLDIKFDFLTAEENIEILSVFN